MAAQVSLPLLSVAGLGCLGAEAAAASAHALAPAPAPRRPSAPPPARSSRRQGPAIRCAMCAARPC